MRQYKYRFSCLCHIGIKLDPYLTHDVEGAGQGSVVTLALVEEIELISAVLQQVFEHAELWAQNDLSGFSEMKDYTLFALTRFLTYCDSESIIASSETEIHLKNITNSRVNRGDQANARLLANPDLKEMNGLDLKAEISLQKIFFNVTFALLNCLLLTQRQEQRGLASDYKNDLIITWFNQSSRPNGGHMHSQQQTFVHNVFDKLDQPLIQIAFDSYRLCQNRMLNRFQKLKTLHEKKEISALYDYVQNMFRNDDWVVKEYSAGYNNSVMCEDGLDEVLEIGQVAIETSCQVSCHLLDKIKSIASNSQFHLSSNLQEMTDQRMVILNAKDLTDFLYLAVKEKGEGEKVQLTDQSRDQLLSRDEIRVAKESQINPQHLEILLGYVEEVKNSYSQQAQQYQQQHYGGSASAFKYNY